MAVTGSFAQALAPRSPEAAHRLAPGNGRITARLARALADGEASQAERSRADRLAREALRRDATAAAAAATLGLNAQLRGETTAARRLFGYAQQLSRRDLQTQLWAIEDMVAKNDIPGALQHYDIVLRIKPTMSDMLYPILTNASTDPQIQPALVRTLAPNPPWAYRFTYHVAANSPDPRATIGLFRELRRAGLSISQGADARALNALIARGGIEEAWRHYSSANPAADRRRSRDPRFTAMLETPTQFDWIAVNRDGVTATIQSDRAGGAFDFTVPTSVGGPLLEQMLLLPPGEYRLFGRSSGIDQAARARPYWILSCGSSRELGRVEIPNSEQANGAFAGRLRVPSGCPVQILALVARPSDAGASGQILHAEVQPVGD